MSSADEAQVFQHWQFDNAFVEALPADPESANFRRQVPAACYSWVTPASVPSPTLIAYSPEVASLLDLDSADCESEAFLQLFSGNRLLPGMTPWANNYGGHQFGHWAGQLGDGRAINLAEVRNRAGEHLTLQLKGAGPTPYSRSADGLAVLRSSLREFLCSEAMHHLGVPTTRALSLVSTGQPVLRDMFYDGNAGYEPGAIVCRVAPTFTRFGSFQIHAARNEIELLRRLVDFTIERDFPELGEPSANVYERWFDEVCQRTAQLMVHWMRVGFVHGVMNTDNLSVLGLTIDYGPYGWLEGYDPDWTPNTTDAGQRRYRYGQQPQVAHWNLYQLANAIAPLLEGTGGLQAALDRYGTCYQQQWQAMMAAKLGFDRWRGEADERLVTRLQDLLRLTETDMTIFYRSLANIDSSDTAQALSDAELMEPLRAAYYRPEELGGAIESRIAQWLRDYQRRLRQQSASDSERRGAMNRVNPCYVLRNYLAQQAIDKAEQGDYSEVETLLELLRHPYQEQPGKAAYAQRRPEWARQRAGCSMLSCSS
ncbi:protein adenylyltransferase SelO [Aestuariirhabdus litorea]|uniref:Protein nucleotidyltransferase YdiU n=1 Tax=Aestuariirhabdus litorea TaxID=2528527 RepID=A0A3P3VMT2_9GAMM|nr:YdiU family protein [Aestuariirhabdus litorea]RRJ84072.1 YdiU family protein [Aestuariirhabdus litorea]RWW97292.1 YdiU family protein [Endozoicomonadaceae bacterium GTF-13]